MAIVLRPRVVTLAIVWLLAAASLALVVPNPAGVPQRSGQNVGLASYATPPDPAHPYSAPVWYPLGAAAISDCYRNNPGWRSVVPGQSTTFTGLTNGKPYRIRTYLGNGYGWSMASAWRTVIPSA